MEEKMETASGEYPESLKEVLSNLPYRLFALLWKIVSMQGVVLGIGTWLVYEKKIDSYAWVIVCTIVLFGRYALDFVKEIKR